MLAHLLAQGLFCDLFCRPFGGSSTIALLRAIRSFAFREAFSHSLWDKAFRSGLRGIEIDALPCEPLSDVFSILGNGIGRPFPFTNVPPTGFDECEI
ncbi:hypothetical protein [Novosphingobium terrae]|uniref:hypothetical protein n=1 Tax=Novosphingobium terrae TaxID=2726189 RepID=UPI001981B979|nr:hypothetical protein [Novosphingobium terrae]